MARGVIFAASGVLSAILLGYAFDIPEGFGESSLPDGSRHPHWALLSILGAVVLLAVAGLLIRHRLPVLTTFKIILIAVTVSGVAAGIAGVADRATNPFHLVGCTTLTNCQAIAGRGGQTVLSPDAASKLVFQGGEVDTGPTGLIYMDSYFQDQMTASPSRVRIVARAQTDLVPTICGSQKAHPAVSRSGTSYCYFLQNCIADAFFRTSSLTYTLDINSPTCGPSFPSVEPQRIQQIIDSLR